PREGVEGENEKARTGSRFGEQLEVQSLKAREGAGDDLLGRARAQKPGFAGALQRKARISAFLFNFKL
ncbi:hypothetical protein, partial [Alcanivorax sp. HI0044]|uniref:hypothetical protein n=1 Tax=Alcanivorax sp. HI0044 TaxID=1822234 RepID=UPI001E3E7473